VYCIHSLKNKDLKKIHRSLNMTVEFFNEIIKQLKEFPHKIKTLVINGVGEPLCNPDFTEILKIAVESKVSDRVEFFTNAILLNKKISDDIIKTKVNRIKISLQGLSESKYYEVCGRKVDFKTLFDNISYLASICSPPTELFIKIINIGLENKIDEFNKLFSFADRLSVENVRPWFNEVNYFGIPFDDESVTNKYGLDVYVPKICPVPFYRYYVDVTGNVFYCYSIRKPAEILNLQKNSLTDIWNSDVRRNF
jgi:MoaA/NifB/PqqE/SkfB family radical SAM enzyme